MSPQPGERILSRRALLARGTAVATGAGLLIAAGFWPLAKADSNSDEAIEDALATLFNSPDGFTVRQLTGKLLIDPAFPTLSNSILDNYSSSLTGFQQSFLQAIQVMTRDPSALIAVVSGSRLTDAQRSSLASIREDLESNPAEQAITKTADRLRRPTNASLLQTYVNGTIATSINLGGPDTSLGNTTLDSIVKEVYALITSTAFTNIYAKVITLIQQPGFIRLLRKYPSVMLENVIPAPVILALTLPNDHDPVLPLTIASSLPVLIYFGGFYHTLLELPELIEPFFLPAAALGGAGAFEVFLLFTVAVVVGIELAHVVNALFEAIDCDHDGDPNDPNDTPGMPGSECPAIPG